MKIWSYLLPGCPQGMKPTHPSKGSHLKVFQHLSSAKSVLLQWGNPTARCTGLHVPSTNEETCPVSWFHLEPWGHAIHEFFSILAFSSSEVSGSAVGLDSWKLRYCKSFIEDTVVASLDLAQAISPRSGSTSSCNFWRAIPFSKTRWTESAMSGSIFFTSPSSCLCSSHTLQSLRTNSCDHVCFPLGNKTSFKGLSMALRNSISPGVGSPKTNVAPVELRSSTSSCSGGAPGPGMVTRFHGSTCASRTSGLSSSWVEGMHGTSDVAR